MAKNSKLYTKASNAIASGRYEHAITTLEKLLVYEPSNTEYLLLMGEALMLNEQFSQAVQFFARVVETDNTNIRALNNFGAALVRNRQLQEALDILVYAIELAPDRIDLYTNLGSVYQGLDQPEKSLEVAFKVIELNPSWFMAYNNLGCALGDLLFINDAKEAYKTAIALKPDYIPSYINLAQLEIKSGNHAKGVELYETALVLKNITNGEKEVVKYYLSHSYLYLGDLRRGWEYYDYGFSDLLPNGAYRSKRKFIQPQWSGDINEEKTILIWGEQGLGDEIFFSTCLSDIHKTNLNIILECDPRLITILRRTYPKFKIRAALLDSKFMSLNADFDQHIAIGSLPKFFRQNINDFKNKSNLWIADSLKSDFIKNKLFPYRNKILIGICWRSGKLSIERNTNYTALQDWEPLLRNTDYQLVNLLHGDCEHEIVEAERLFDIKILRWSDIDLKNDLETVLALVSELDCVTSVGTAVSTISAAAGVPTLLLVQRNWDSLGQNNFYPWFDSVIPFVVEPNDHVGINISKLSPFIKKRIN